MINTKQSRVRLWN